MASKQHTNDTPKADDTESSNRPAQGSTSSDRDIKESRRGSNFANDREKAREAGRKGGQHSHSGSSK